MESSDLARLFHRSYGGEDVATRPGIEDEEFWPKGPMLPGVGELVEDAERAAQSASGLTLYFLLGGAGNGKSFAARELGSKIGLKSGDDKIARRIYTLKLGDVEFALLNDATIAPGADYGSSQDAALAYDIRQWTVAAKERPVVAFCCVNRGIIIDEIRAIHDLPDDPLGLRSMLPILRWLADPGDATIQSIKREGDQLRQLASQYVDQVSIEIDEVRIELLAASVDRFSLIKGPWIDNPPATSLMAEVLAKSETEAATRDPLCPIKANIEQLTDPKGLVTWTSLVEAAEMASGRNLSYRDLWGLIALSTVGPRVTKVSEDASHLGSVDVLLERVHQAKSASERLGALLYLTQFRASSSLFRAPVPLGDLADPIYPVSNPYEQGFAMVDPASWGTKDTHAVESAMSGISVGQLPSDNLTDLLGGNWSAFDAQVERDLVSYCQEPSCSDVTRRRLISWFGGYIARAVALSTGRFGNEDVLEAWKNLVLATSSGPAPVPQALSSAFRALLFPQLADLDNQLVVPALAPRAEPIRSTQGDRRPTLVNLVDHSSVAIKARQVSGRLVLECGLAGGTTPLGRLIVDFPLIRDALTWNTGREGQTESTAFIEPRLERCRASTVNSLPVSHRKLAALVNGRASEVY